MSSQTETATAQWKIIWANPDKARRIENEDTILCEFSHCGPKAAAFIVRACNSHEELLEACKELISLLRVENPEHKGNPVAHEKACKANRKKIEAAIAKASPPADL